MGKKTIIFILIIIIIISIGYIYFNQNSDINIDGDSFKLPEGYVLGKNNSAGDINITNGTNSIFISKYDTNNISNQIKYYKNERESQNETVILSNLTNDGMDIYKADNINTSSIHYWFLKNDHVYSIYNWENNPKMDEIALELIKTINS